MHPFPQAHCCEVERSYHQTAHLSANSSASLASAPISRQGPRVRICLSDQELELLPEPAIWFPQSRILLIADTHFGKSAAFRKQGIPVPEGELGADLDRIHTLSEKYDPSRIIVAGDFLHSRFGITDSLTVEIQTLLEKLPCPIEIATGNHDRRAGELSLARLTYQPEIDVEGLSIIHDPADFRAGASGIAGHLHPVILLRTGKRSKIRVPCFWLREGRQLILPSFGSFTGGHPIAPLPNDRVFAVMRDKVAEIPAKVW